VNGKGAAIRAKRTAPVPASVPHAIDALYTDPDDASLQIHDERDAIQ
jgi:hypothetical protein